MILDAEQSLRIQMELCELLHLDPNQVKQGISVDMTGDSEVATISWVGIAQIASSDFIDIVNRAQTDAGGSKP